MLPPLAAEHKASARKPSSAPPPLGPTKEQLQAVQARVDEFVKRATDLLELERAAEVEATKRALDGQAMPVEEEDRDNSLRKIVAVRSYTGVWVLFWVLVWVLVFVLGLTPKLLKE